MHVQPETELPGVERDGSLDIFDYVANLNGGHSAESAARVNWR
jgi:hypothetical protein